MKKSLSLILALVLCLSLCACGGNLQEQQNDHESTTGENTEVMGNDPLVFFDEGENLTMINAARFHEIVEKVELTMENWQSYIGVRSYTEVTTEKDAFGEVVSTQSSVKYILGGKEDKFYAFDEFAIEFKNKETGELTVFSAIFGKAPEVTADFQLEQHECTRIKGAMYFFDVPEEVITANQYGDRVFYVGYRSELMYGPPHSFYEKGSGSYAIDGPFGMFF